MRRAVRRGGRLGWDRFRSLVRAQGSGARRSVCHFTAGSGQCSFQLLSALRMSNFLPAFLDLSRCSAVCRDDAGNNDRLKASARWIHVSRNEGAGHGRADRRGLQEDRGAGLPGPRHAGRAAHRHRHHRKSRRSRARHAGRDAGRPGTHPRQQALQTGQPRRERGKHGHHFPGTDATIGGRDLAVIAGPCAIENREQAMAVAEQVCQAGRAILPRRRLQAAHLALLVPGPGRRRA